MAGGGQQRDAPSPAVRRRGGVPVGRGVTAVGDEVDGVVAGLEVDDAVGEPVLRIAAGGVGVLVSHLPHAAMIGADNPAVVEHPAVASFAQRVDAHVHRPRDA